MSLLWLSKTTGDTVELDFLLVYKQYFISDQDPLMGLKSPIFLSVDFLLVYKQYFISDQELISFDNHHSHI